MRKQLNASQHMWSQLCLKYRQWEDMVAKGKMRMKKKLDKQGKPYYDFDFSRYQYYYSFPEDHISLAAPAAQKKLIQKALEDYSQDYTKYYVDDDQKKWKQIEQILQPYEFYTLLYEMKKQFHERVTMLRIQKTLRIKQIKSHFLSQSNAQKAMIQLIDSEIRSYTHKLIKINDIFYSFGEKYQKRVETHQSYLKTRTIDELQIGNLDKSEIIIFLKSKQIKHCLSFNNKCIIKMIENIHAVKQKQIQSRIQKIKSQKIKIKKQYNQQWKMTALLDTIKEVQKIDSNHFQSVQNKQKIADLIQSLDYISAYQKNFKKATNNKFIKPESGPIYTGLNYDQFLYRPKNKKQLLERLHEKCLFYFEQKLLSEDILKSSDQHISYKLNNLCFLQLKALWQTYDPAAKFEEGNLITIRNLMKMELNLIFSRNIDKLLNIRQHSLKIFTSEKWIPNIFHKYVPRSQKQSIMSIQLSDKKRYRDPLIVSFISLLDVKKDTIIRQQIQKYAKKVVEKSESIYIDLLNFYNNCCTDDKKHLVNVLNNLISLKSSQTTEQKNLTMYLKALYRSQCNNKTDNKNSVLKQNLLYSHYLIVFLRCIEYKYRLLEILNAQKMCMISIQNRLKLLWKKGRIPFNVSQEFVSRFMEVNDPNYDPFSFVNEEVCDQHLETMFKDIESAEIQNDRIVWNNFGVEVHRKKSENALLEGKSIIYEQSIQDLEEALSRIELLCSKTIRFRQKYGVNGQISELVDRLELIFTFLEKQKNFQNQKLNLLTVYENLFSTSVAPQAIKQIYQTMHDIKLFNNIVDLTQSNFCVSYDNQTKMMSYRVKILQDLLKKQTEFQYQHIKKVFESHRRFNLTNKMPEISSLYYTQEIAVQDKLIIQEQQQQSNFNEGSVDFQNQNNFQNPMKMSLHSETSSLVGDSNQYHLKVSFQQILSKNCINQIKSDNNKKQQLLNRKKQLLINDTILGSFIPRKDYFFQLQDDVGKKKVDYTFYVYYVLSVMNKIQELLNQHVMDLDFCTVFLEQITGSILDYKFKSYVPMIKPDQLTLALNSSHKTLQKYLQRSKNQSSSSSRQSNDHMLAIPFQIMKKILKNESSEQVDDMRGLFICLNIVHINQISFLTEIDNQMRQNCKNSYYPMLKQCLDKYSPGSEQRTQLQNSLNQSIESKLKSNMKFIDILMKNGESYYLSVGNYMHYYKAVSALSLSFNKFISALNQYFWFCTQENVELMNQLELIQTYECCSSLYSKLYMIPNITSKVFIPKKIDFLRSYQKSYIKTQKIKQIHKIIDKIFATIQPFTVSLSLSKSSSAQSLVSLSEQFSTFISQISVCSILLNYTAHQILSYKKNRNQIEKLQEYVSILPFIDKSLYIEKAPDNIISKVFSVTQFATQANNAQYLGFQKVNLEIFYEELILPTIINTFQDQNKGIINEWVSNNMFTRVKKEFVYDPQLTKYYGYEHRHCRKMISNNQSSLAKKINKSQKWGEKSQRSLKIKLSIQSQLIVFGGTLEAGELLKLRKILLNPSMSFHIFWNNNLQNIINPKQLSKMRSQLLETQKVIEQYRQSYLNFGQLRKSYASFVEDLSEFEFRYELSDSFLMLYPVCKQYFKRKQFQWSFLLNFAHHTTQIPDNKVDRLFQFIYDDNPARSLDQNTLRWPAVTFNNNAYNFGQMKFYAWTKCNDDSLKRSDQTKRFMKYRLNDLQSRSLKPLGNQISLCFYRKQRLKQLFNYLSINKTKSSDDFKNDFEKLIQNSHITLHPWQKTIYYMSQKDNASKPEFTKIKDDILNIIISNQFNDKIVRQYFYQFSRDIIDEQLSLQKILLEDKKSQIFSTNTNDQLIMKQTFNKILIPKVKLNPFLSSPLKHQNYFFAGTAKLSYIDQFLNKLRNRAVLIELAQGGVGYLLKVNQLDQAVDILCKSIVGFSEKQFSDRLRTFYESYDDLREKFLSERLQKQKLKRIVQAYKFQQGKEVKSIVYEKLTDYLIRFHEETKNYNILVNLLKMLESKSQKQLNQKYQQELQFLRKRNKNIQGNFIEFQSQFQQIANTNITQLRDFLIKNFKDKAQTILKKQFLAGISQTNNHEENQQHQSTLLLKKLKMQKSFYEMKVNQIQNHYNHKIKSLQKKLIEQNKLQNLLTIEQEKVYELANQLKQLQKCSIENQVLKREMQKKEEEETMAKFRLLKVNQSLKGKIKRYDEQRQANLNIVEKAGMIHNLNEEKEKGKQREKEREKEIEREAININFNKKIEINKHKKRSRFSMHVNDHTQHSPQTSQKNYHSFKRTGYLKTQGDIFTNYNKSGSFQIRQNDKKSQWNAWKQKWLRSSQSQQQLVDKIKKIMEHLSFTKNIEYACEGMRALIIKYQNK